MDHHLCEAEICRALIEQAERVVLVADHTKFAASGLVVACGFDDIDLLVTDQRPPSELMGVLEAADAQILIGGGAGAAELVPSTM